MIKDIQFALRQALKTPGFVLVVVLSLALGIAANATVISWLNRLVLRPLPGVHRQGEIVVFASNQGSGGVSLLDLRDLVRAPGAFSGAVATMYTPACLTVDRRLEWVESQIVTANFFDVLGVRAILGRTLLPNEDQQPGGNPVLVISERLWRRRFNADPEIVGKVVDLNRHAFTIVGVVPEEFAGTLPPMRVEVWAPASMIEEVRNQGRYFLTRRSARGWHNFARLGSGVSVDQAQAAVKTVDAQLAQAYPKDNRDVQHRVLPYSKCPWGGQTVLGPALWLLLFVCVGVQLIVTANVANLLLSRAVDRRREVAIRLAAGASRVRIIRQLLTESVFLALLGGLLGVAVASWSVDTVVFLLPKEAREGAFRLALDGITVALTFGITIATGLLFGLAPALHAVAPDLAEALQGAGRSGGTTRSQNRLRRLLVVGEVALALVLLVSAGLCAKGLREAQRVDFGFKTDRVLTAQLQIGMNGYNRTTGLTFYRELRQRLAEAPGVEEAALASWFPLGLNGCKGTNVDVEGYERPRGENPTCEFALISPRYFATMRIPLVAGRDFSDADSEGAPLVAIVNEHFANRYWPGQDPIGRRFRASGAWRTVVGVAKAGKYNRLDEGPWPFIFLPYQQGVPDLDLSICARSTGDAASLLPTFRSTLRQIDPGVELLKTRTLVAYTRMAFFAHHMASTLLVLLGGIALLLAALGVYAVIAYSVSQRTRELGVRIALGAEPKTLLMQVVWQGLSMGLLGVGVGAGIALAATGLLSGFLYGVSRFDPLTFGATAVVLLGVAALACVVPARRAMRVNPIEALRAE